MGQMLLSFLAMPGMVSWCITSSTLVWDEHVSGPTGRWIFCKFLESFTAIWFWILFTGLNPCLPECILGCSLAWFLLSTPTVLIAAAAAIMIGPRSGCRNRCVLSCVLTRFRNLWSEHRGHVLMYLRWPQSRWKSPADSWPSGAAGVMHKPQLLFWTLHNIS